MTSSSLPPLYSRADLGAVYLPVGQMLQIDRTLAISEGRVECEIDLGGHWVFPLHFPKDPIFPACLMIEGAGQAIAIWAWHNHMPGLPRLVRVDASFASAAGPGDGILSVRGKMRRRLHLCRGLVELFCGERLVATIEETLAFI